MEFRIFRKLIHLERGSRPVWTPLERRQRRAHIDVMDTSPPKIDQLVAEAKAELKRLGIDTEGKRPDQLLTMAREARIHPRVAPKPE